MLCSRSEALNDTCNDKDREKKKNESKTMKNHLVVEKAGASTFQMNKQTKTMELIAVKREKKKL